MRRFGSGAAVVTLAMLCTLALSAGPALASTSTAHTRKPTPHRVGGKVHEFHVWPSAAAGAWLILDSAHPTLFPSQS